MENSFNRFKKIASQEQQEQILRSQLQTLSLKEITGFKPRTDQLLNNIYKADCGVQHIL